VAAIREPILYPSLYFEMNRQKYYELLDRVRTHGDWETWLEFFLSGVKETAQQAADTSREILTLIVKRTAGKLRSSGGSCQLGATASKNAGAKQEIPVRGIGTTIARDGSRGPGSLPAVEGP